MNSKKLKRTIEPEVLDKLLEGQKSYSSTDALIVDLKKSWDEYPKWKRFIHNNIWLPIAQVPMNIRFFFQRRIRGFDDGELWSLDTTISNFILPRLIEYKKQSMEVVEHDEEFLQELDEMIWFFEETTSKKYYEEDGLNCSMDKEKIERAEKAVALFAKNYLKLWW